jgi:2-keto-3-deoxy-L-rhamnonate aldolase RhmA
MGRVLSKMNKPLIGTWITTYNIPLAEVMSNCGFDWICIDLEHSSISLEQLGNILLVLEKNKTFSFVRLSENNNEQIKKVLDLGAQGIIVPLITNSLEVKKIVQNVNYPPLGSRSYGFGRAHGFGYNFEKYLRNQSKKIKILIQIETLEAINNLEEILKVGGIDGTLIGPYDLTGSLDIPGKFKNKIYLNCLLKYEKLSRKFKVPMGIHFAFPDSTLVNKSKKNGYKFIATGTDMTFLGNACKKILSNT